jgi:hypothetical protein
LKAFVGVTDNDWFAFLASLPGIDEVNFRQPVGMSELRLSSCFGGIDEPVQITPAKRSAMHLNGNLFGLER